jgi:hypothetical protein
MFVGGLPGWFCLAILIGCLSPSQGQDPPRLIVPGVDPAPQPEEREKDRENMMAIYQALKAYEKDVGELPDWLSDLFPKYLQDTNVLVSPQFLRTGREVLYGMDDPVLTTSYIYEFSAKPVSASIRNAFPQLDPDATMKEWKTRQTEELGTVVPILRCHLYQPVLSVTLDGEFFVSGTLWENDPKTLELRKKRRAAAAESGEEQSGP